MLFLAVCHETFGFFMFSPIQPKKILDKDIAEVEEEEMEVEKEYTDAYVEVEEQEVKVEEEYENDPDAKAQDEETVEELEEEKDEVDEIYNKYEDEVRSQEYKRRKKRTTAKGLTT